MPVSELEKKAEINISMIRLINKVKFDAGIKLNYPPMTQSLTAQTPK